MKRITVKKSAENKIEALNPWIYKNEIKKIPQNVLKGEIVEIYSEKGKFLGIGYINVESKITVRILSFFEKADLDKLIVNRIEKAVEERESFKKITDAYRLIHSEADLLPGLIVDYYNGYISLQINTAGMENFRNLIVQTLINILSPKGIYDSSDEKVRKKEGLETKNEVIYGKIPEKIQITENGIKFSVNIKESQKTGFFLDQRKNRKVVSEYVKEGFRVLDLFSNAGGFGIYAVKNGADFVKFVDISKFAISQIKENCQINSVKNYEAIREDAFDFLKKEIDAENRYDLIIIDPPSFAKTKNERQGALRGFKYLIVNSLRLLKENGYLAVFSCSYHISLEDLINLSISSSKINRDFLEIKEFLYQDKDHPVLLNIPHSLYLKGLLLRKK